MQITVRQIIALVPGTAQLLPEPIVANFHR